MVELQVKRWLKSLYFLPNSGWGIYQKLTKCDFFCSIPLIRDEKVYSFPDFRVCGTLISVV